MAKRWLPTIGVITLAMAAIAAAVSAYVVVNDISTSTTTVSSELVLTWPSGRNAVVFVGDEFSTSDAVDLAEKSWTSEIASVNGLAEVNWSVHGMGFVHRPQPERCAGENCKNILEQVPRIVAQNPAVVVVAAGVNDQLETPADISAAIDTVFDALRIGLPSAKIVAVGPASITEVPAPSLLALDGFIRAAAEKTSATYISLLSPAVIDASMISADGIILDSIGHKAMATRIHAGLGE